MSDEEKSPLEIMEGFTPDEAEAETLEDFPPEIREDVDGLLWLGYLEDSFDFCGHQFVIRTLRGDEELLAGLICKEYVETLGQARAWAWAQISLALVSVDGDENFCPPIGPDKRAYARARFQFCTGKWFWPVAEFLLARYADLGMRQVTAIRRVENLYAGSPTMFSPSPGSSTDKDDSEDTEPTETAADYLDPQD